MPDGQEESPLDVLTEELDKINIKDEKAFDLFTPLTMESAYWRPELTVCGQRLVTTMKVNGRTDLLILGAAGTGKTGLIKLLLEEIKKKFSLDFTPHFASCRDGNTTHSVLRQYLKEKKPPNAPILDIIQSLEAEFAQGTHILILDEADLLQDSDIFYHLPRRQGFQRTSLILLSKTSKFLSELPVDVKSSFEPYSIYFDNYAPSQLFTILQKRAAMGLIECHDGILNYVAAVTVREARGDVRIALRVTKALCQYRPVPSEADLIHMQEKITASIRDGQQHIRQNFLPSLATFNLKILSALSDKPTLSRDAYATYCRQEKNPLSYSQFWKACQDLEYLDLISGARFRNGRSTQLRVECLLDETGRMRLQKILEDRESYE